MLGDTRQIMSPSGSGSGYPLAESSLTIDVGDDEFRSLEDLKFILEIKGIDTTTLRCVTASVIMDGGNMLEFRDPETGDYMGCIGIHTFKNGLTDGTIGIVDDS